VTRATILTRVWLTIINIQFAILTLKSLPANALVTADSILTNAIVQAWE
jgi:hypothetical protein